jgi:hypothetical protein
MSTRSTPVLAIVAAALLTLSSGCASLRSGQQQDEVARGREQLVRAFDAAWVRVIASGRDREILRTEPPNQPGAAVSYMVTLVDCLPLPEITPFPEKPVGLLKEILDRGVIRQLVQNVPNGPGDTSYYFSGTSDKFMAALLDEMGRHYGVQLRVENVALPPGPLPSTSALLNGSADFVGQLNATGGETQGMRRRNSRRYTCTLSASSQYIHIPASAPLAKEINSWDDLLARPDVRICAGPLTTQTARAFLPKNKVTTKYVNDISGCVRDIETGKADVILNPLPSLQIAKVDGYKSVSTRIAAGTPLWVAREGIECPDDGNPRTEDPCIELNAP